MLNSNVFDYINVLDKGADAVATRNSLIANNIANAATPGYKRKDLSFESELRHAIKYAEEDSVDGKVRNISLRRLNPRIYTDYSNFSYRLDGNNVDIDIENTRLAANQIKYNAIIDSITQEFTNLNTVTK